MVPLPPAPSKTPPIQPIINTNSSQDGAVFGRRGFRTSRQPIDNSVGNISDVSINVHSYNCSIFDANGTRLAWRLCRFWCSLYTVSDCIFTKLYRLFSVPTGLHHIGMIVYRISKAVKNTKKAHSVIYSYQILNMLKVANLALILGQTHDVPVNMNLLENLFNVELLQLRGLHHP